MRVTLRNDESAKILLEQLLDIGNELRLKFPLS